MKKIVPMVLIISLQVIVSCLILLFEINDNRDLSYGVSSNKLKRLSQFVYSENSILEDVVLEKEVIDTYTGILTGYGPDCYGCGNFKTNKVSTSSGYHIADIVDGVIQEAFTITYNDDEFGEVRILAADASIPYKSIIRVTIQNKESFLAIVLDRGSTVGFSNCRSKNGCLTNFDLLFSKESDAIGKTRDVLFEVLRMGE